MLKMEKGYKPAQKVELLKDRPFIYGTINRAAIGEGIIYLKKGDIGKYFAHTDVYCFEAQQGIVPFYDRFFVEGNPELFKPI